MEEKESHQHEEKALQQPTAAPKKAIARSDWFMWICFFAACSSPLLFVLFCYTVVHQVYEYNPGAPNANPLGYVTNATWAFVVFICWLLAELAAIVFGHLAVAKRHKGDGWLLLSVLMITYLLLVVYIPVLGLLTFWSSCHYPDGCL